MKPFIYFDAGGVLFHIQEALTTVGKKHGLKYEDFQRVFKKNNEAVLKGFSSAQDLWEIYQKELGFSEPNIDFLDLWTSHLQPIAETHALVRDFYTKGYRIGLITNLYSGVFEKALNNGAIPNIPYVAVIQSSELHTMKPEKEIYLQARVQANTKPDNILYIDDNPNFVNAAKRLGWNTVLFHEWEPKNSVEVIKSIVSMLL